MAKETVDRHRESSLKLFFTRSLRKVKFHYVNASLSNSG